MNSQAFSGGLSVVAWSVTASVSLVFMALYFLPRYLKSGFTTVPEFLEERYDKATRNIVAVLFLISLIGIMLPTVLYSGAIAINALFDVSKILNVSEPAALIISIWAIGIIGGIYAIFGGLKAVAISDTINGIGLVLGGLLIPIIGFSILGDGNFFTGVETLVVKFPDKTNVIGSADSPVPFSGIFTGMLLINTFYWCTNQVIVQRALGAKSLAEGQKGALYAGFLIILVPAALSVPGLIVFALNSGNVAHPDMAYPMLVNQVLPAPLLGFFGAVIFGAVLSTFNSALNSASTLFCLNIYKPIFKPAIGDQNLVKVGKIFALFVGLCAIFIAPYFGDTPEGFFIFMKRFMGFFNVPTLVIVLVGFFSKKIPPIAAKISLFTFMVIYGLVQYVLKIPINFLHLLGILFILCVTIMFVIGKIAPMKQAYKQSEKNVVPAIPWKYANSFSAIVVSFLIYFYVLLSPIGLIGLSFGEVYPKFAIITSIFLVISIVAFKIFLPKKKNIE